MNEQCLRCRLFAHSAFLTCAIHPTGPTMQHCPDFEPDPSHVPEEPWAPLGFSYYAGEFVPKPRHELTDEERLELLDWHPLFTGRCPNCEMPLPQTMPVRTHWDCEHCGWMDDTI